MLLRPSYPISNSTAQNVTFANYKHLLGRNGNLRDVHFILLFFVKWYLLNNAKFNFEIITEHTEIRNVYYNVFYKNCCLLIKDDKNTCETIIFSNIQIVILSLFNSICLTSCFFSLSIGIRQYTVVLHNILLKHFGLIHSCTTSNSRHYSHNRFHRRRLSIFCSNKTTRKCEYFLLCKDIAL